MQKNREKAIAQADSRRDYANVRIRLPLSRSNSVFPFAVLTSISPPLQRASTALVLVMLRINDPLLVSNSTLPLAVVTSTLLSSALKSAETALLPEQTIRTKLPLLL